jgi:uncharacterized protein YkwD
LLAAGVLAAHMTFAPRPFAAAILTGDCTPDSSWPASDASLASQVMTLINQHRASLGEGQLSSSSALTASAVWKARHMAEFDYFAHDDPGPPTATTPARTWSDRLQTCGYPYGAGENIAEGFPDAQSVVNAWLNSPGHKANIENSSYVVTGVGVAEGSNGEIYWVQDFGQVADSGSPPPPPPTTTTAPTTTSAPPPTTSTTTTTTSSGGGGGSGTTGTTTSGGSSGAPSGSAGTQGTTSSTRALRLTAASLTVGTRRLALSTRVIAAGKLPAKASVKCSARVGTRYLRVVVNAYRGRLAHCAWRLPARLARGATARGFLIVRGGGAHVRGSFSLILKPA